MDAVSEVKSRLNIEDVIGEYVQLKRSGRNFKGLSPWTNEKTPSFMVSPEKQIWHDFSSGRGGDMFSFVMEMEGMDFKAALEHLARKAGVELEQFKSSTSGSRARYKSRALEVLELATKFYQKQLIANKPAISYLIKDRGFTKKTILDWRLGYAPNTGFALTDWLTKRGFDALEMRRAGLIVQRRDTNSDMFRGRIIIPLADSRGTIIGFTARLIVDDPEAPKYINTPATIVYDKGRHIFGLHLAKEAVRKQGFVVAVEGNMDVISSHQAKITNVIASAGTAMTQQHLRELKRFTGDIRLSFDSDRAGMEATERVIPLAQKAGVSLSIISTPGSKDPDELIRKDSELWQRAIEKAKYAPDWLLSRYKSELDLSTASGKKAFTDSLLAVVRRLVDPVEKEHYLKKVADAVGISLDAVRAKLDMRSSDMDVVPRKKVLLTPSAISREDVEYQRFQDHLLSITLLQPKTRGVLKDFRADFFNDGPPKKVYEFLTRHPDFKGEVSKAKELQEVADYVKIISLQFEELYQDLDLDDLKAQAEQLKRRLIGRYVKTQKEKLAAEMKTESDEEKIRRLAIKADKLNQLIMSSKGVGNNA